MPSAAMPLHALPILHNPSYWQRECGEEEGSETRRRDHLDGLRFRRIIEPSRRTAGVVAAGIPQLNACCVRTQ